MDKEEARILAKEVVKEILIELGVSIDNSDAKKEMQKDFLHLRRWRQAFEAAGKRILLVIVTAITAGIMSLIYANFGGK